MWKFLKFAKFELNKKIQGKRAKSSDGPAEQDRHGRLAQWWMQPATQPKARWPSVLVALSRGAHNVRVRRRRRPPLHRQRGQAISG
jgi:hypothetical protein